MTDYIDDLRQGKCKIINYTNRLIPTVRTMLSKLLNETSALIHKHNLIVPTLHVTITIIQQECRLVQYKFDITVNTSIDN